MSVPISLIQMPNVVMGHIMEYLDFKSIFTMRKVCHGLRNFIDDTKPASHLNEIVVTVKPELIRVWFKQHTLTTIEYLKKGEGCWVGCVAEEKIKRTIVEDEDFLTVFCKDFDIALRHQKTVLENFGIDFKSSNSTVKERVLENVHKLLKSMKHPLQVKSFYMGMNNHNEILTILPYINPSLLECINIEESPRSCNVVLNLEKIGQLEQWKQAGELIIHGFRLPDLPQNLKHFSKISFAFDQPFLADSHWFFKTPDTNQFFEIKRESSCIISFRRIEQSDVPQNAPVLN